jgi:hypothetical protein
MFHSKIINSMKKGKIYVLIDPRDQKIRYVGLTVLTLKHRLGLHLSEKPKKSYYKTNWIAKLKSEGLEPIIKEIDKADKIEELRNKELYWINYYLDKGERLLNYITTFSNVPYKDLDQQLSRKVIQYDLEGNKIAEYRNAMEAACILGKCSDNPTIYSICNDRGRRYTYKNFVFRFEGDSFDKYKIVKVGVHKVPDYHKKYLAKEARKRNSNFNNDHWEKMKKASLKVWQKPIVRISDGKEWNSIKEAMEETGYSSNFFMKHLKNKLKRIKPQFKYKI